MTQASTKVQQLIDNNSVGTLSLCFVPRAGPLLMTPRSCLLQVLLPLLQADQEDSG